MGTQMTSETSRSPFEDVAFTTAVPFSDDGSAVRQGALAENVAGLYEAGGRLFIPCGNTGEYYALTDEERIEIVATHVAATGDDATIVAGAAGSVPEIARLAEAYRDAGADAVMVMHPDHTYAHEDGLIEYYHRICDAVDLDVVIYKRGPEIARRVLVELSEREEVVAVKFALDDVKEFAQTVEDADGDVTWMNGIAERYAIPFAVEGATGFTTGVGNFVPEASLALFDALESEDWERAREIRELLRPLEDLRDETGGGSIASANNVPVVKYGLDLAGYTGGPVREPLVDLAESDKERVERHYAAIEEFE